jgi:fructose-1,6-bisphosphatase II
MKYVHLDLVRITEAAAIAASYWIGSGDKESADRDATEAIKKRLEKTEARFKVVIGEGKKDKSYGLFNGEEYGTGEQLFDFAVDPIEGTRPTVTSGPEAISTIGIAGPGCLFATEEFYTNKLAYGPEIRSKTKLNLRDEIETIVSQVSLVTNKDLHRLNICILDRPRHEDTIKRLRNLGVRIKLIQDCDVSGAIATCFIDRGIDLLYGVGGAPECVLAACAIKCLGGDLQAQVTDKDGKPLDDKVLELEDLVKGECAFAATGITDGSFLKGVRFLEKGPVTHSVAMRSESGTVRWLTTFHGN